MGVRSRIGNVYGTDSALPVSAPLVAGVTSRGAFVAVLVVSGNTGHQLLRVVVHVKEKPLRGLASQRGGLSARDG